MKSTKKKVGNKKHPEHLYLGMPEVYASLFCYISQCMSIVSYTSLTFCHLQVKI